MRVYGHVCATVLLVLLLASSSSVLAYIGGSYTQDGVTVSWCLDGQYGLVTATNNTAAPVSVVFEDVEDWVVGTESDITNETRAWPFIPPHATERSRKGWIDRELYAVLGINMDRKACISNAEHQARCKASHECSCSALDGGGK